MVEDTLENFSKSHAIGAAVFAVQLVGPVGVIIPPMTFEAVHRKVD